VSLPLQSYARAADRGDRFSQRLPAWYGPEARRARDVVPQPLKRMGTLELNGGPGADELVKLCAGRDAGDDVHGPADACVEVFELERLGGG
jgi:hypothetical protein